MAPDKSGPTGPGRPGITLEQVREAVEAWVARTGTLPSSRQVRSELGDTGSLSTIGQHLRTVKADRLIEGDKPAAGTAEAITLKAMTAALTVLSTEASDAAEAIIKEAERKAEARVQAALSLQQKADARAAEMEKQCERACGLADAQRERIEQLSLDVERLRRQRSQAQDAEAGERDAKQELQLRLTRLSAQKESLEKDISELRSQRDTLSEKLDRMDGDRTSMRVARDHLKEALLGKQQLLTQSEQNLDNERETVARLSKEVQAHQRTITTLSSAKDKLADVRATLSGALSENDALKAERDRLLSEIESRWDRLSKH